MAPDRGPGQAGTRPRPGLGRRCIAGQGADCYILAMIALRAIGLVCAVLLGLFAVPSARAHGGHHHHHGATVQAERPDASAPGAVAISSLFAMTRGGVETGWSPGDRAAGHPHATCCATGLSCPICVLAIVEIGEESGAATSRPPLLGQSPPPRVVIEAPPEPPRTRA